MSVTYFSGRGWCDVIALPDGGFAGVYYVDGAVVCVRLGGAELWRVSVPTDHLRYLRAACSPAGDVAAIGVGSDDIAYVVTRSGAVRYGQAHGQNPVGIWHDGLQFVPVIQRTSESYSVGQEWIAFPADIKGTSQGFRDVLEDGTIIFGDYAHVQHVNGVTLHKPMGRGRVFVGQIDGSDRIDGILNPTAANFLRFTAIPGPAFEPHVAASVDQSQHAVCARTPHGAAFLIVPPYPPVGDSNTPIPPDPEPPDPKPEEPKPVAIPDYKPLVEEIRNALYPNHIGKPLNDRLKAFQITKHVAWRLRDQGFGLVAAKPGSDNNAEGYTSDVVALRDGRHWDTLSDGEGAAFADWRKVPDEHNGPIVARWREPIQPPVGGDGGDPGDENDQLKPRVKALEETVSELRATIAALRTDNAALHAQLDALANKPPQSVDIDALLGLIADRLRVEGTTSRDWGHAHRVSLKAQP
jgi:hypothetical protein